MPVPEFFPLQVFGVLGSLPPMPGSLLAYGPAPGIELIPYFLGLAAWAGLAFVAILLAPFTALLRRLRGTKRAPAAEPKNEAPNVPLPEPAREDNRNGT